MWHLLLIFILFLLTSTFFPQIVKGENEIGFTPSDSIFDDKILLNGYIKKYQNASKETLLPMLGDESLTPYKSAAAIYVLAQDYLSEVVAGEKNFIEKNLLRRLNRTDSAFVEVELMHALVVLDRYKYFKVMVPALIKKMDHYNQAVGDNAFDRLVSITETGSNKAREARIVLNTLRKMFFLMRNRLQNVNEPGAKLKQKLILLRWAIKVLGTQTLDQLPAEVVRLL